MSHEDDPQVRMRQYLERQEYRTKMGRSLIVAFRYAEALKGSEKTEMVEEIRDYAIGFSGAPEELVDMLHKAAIRVPEAGKLPVVALRDLGPGEIETEAEAYRIHPLVRQDWAARIKAGTMKTIVMSYERDDEPAARVNLKLHGPDETEVLEATGNVPWVHGLWVLEAQRSIGVGNELMLECEWQVISSLDLPEVMALGVEPNNLEARAMYEKLGYKYRQVAGKDTYQSLPEFEGDEPREMMLMVKDLQDEVGNS